MPCWLELFATFLCEMSALAFHLVACAFVAPPPTAERSATRVLARRAAPPLDLLVLPSLDRDAAVTRSLQAVYLSAAAGAVVAPQFMNDGVANMWHAIDSVPFVHDRMFEADLAVAAFVLWIFLFESLHLVLPNAASYRFDKTTPTRPLWGFTREWWKSVVPAVTYLGSIYVFHELHLGQLLFGVKPAFDDPTFGRVATEVSLGIFLYDMLFYPFHLSFHKLRSSSWRKLHGRHHQWGARESASHNAVETVQNHYLDAGVQVAINICVQNFSPWGFKHPLSRILHNLMVTYLLCASPRRTVAPYGGPLHAALFARCELTAHPAPLIQCQIAASRIPATTCRSCPTGSSLGCSAARRVMRPTTSRATCTFTSSSCGLTMRSASPRREGRSPHRAAARFRTSPTWSARWRWQGRRRVRA